MTYFTTDLHIGHKNIIEYCKRPYADIKQMYDAQVKMFKVVKPDDHVYILGDMGFSTKLVKSFGEAIPKANYYLIKGNHDSSDIIKQMDWVWVKDLATVCVDNAWVTLCHYPLGAWTGNYHLHGHTHGGYWRTKPNMYDPGPDARGRMKLWAWPDLRSLMDKDVASVKRAGFDAYTKNYKNW